MKLLSICIFINASMQVKYYAYARYASEMKTGGASQTRKRTCSPANTHIRFVTYLRNIFQAIFTFLAYLCTARQQQQLQFLTLLLFTRPNSHWQCKQNARHAKGRNRSTQAVTFSFQPPTSNPVFLFFFFC